MLAHHVAAAHRVDADFCCRARADKPLASVAGIGGIVQLSIDGVGHRIEVADGRATATAGSSTADIETDGPTAAAVLMGDLPVETAVTLGRLAVRTPQVLPTLAALVAGPPPYCHEYF